eukprot:38335-Pleurochrysis_carterae.AAC.1
MKHKCTSRPNNQSLLSDLSACKRRGKLYYPWRLPLLTSLRPPHDHGIMRVVAATHPSGYAALYTSKSRKENAIPRIVFSQSQGSF